MKVSSELQAGVRADRHDPAERPAAAGARPLLMVDIDGVISLFGAPGGAAREQDGAGDPRPLDGCLHSIEGIPHFLSSTAASHLLALGSFFDLVWASGWEEKANEHLPRLLGLPRSLPFLSFSRPADGAEHSAGSARTQGHWKLDAIDTYADGRPLAWIDDALSPACHQWAAARAAPTLLVQTRPEQGLTAQEARLLEGWALALQAA